MCLLRYLPYWRSISTSFIFLERLQITTQIGWRQGNKRKAAVLRWPTNKMNNRQQTDDNQQKDEKNKQRDNNIKTWFRGWLPGWPRPSLTATNSRPQCPGSDPAFASITLSLPQNQNIKCYCQTLHLHQSSYPFLNINCIHLADKVNLVIERLDLDCLVIASLLNEELGQQVILKPGWHISC